MARREFGTIFERKGSRKLYVRFPVGRGRPPIERPAGTSREIAKKKLRRVRHLLDEGVTVEKILHEVFGDALPGCITFRDAIAPYLEFAERKRKPSTYKGYVHLLNTAKEAPWTERALDAIEPADIAQWLDALDRAGKAPQTINNHHTIVSAVFRWAIKMGHAASNPASAADWEPQGKGRETYLSPVRARELVRALDPPLRSFVVCALLTGMRRGELQSLRWGSVDLKGGSLTVEASTAKTKDRRTIRMEGRLLVEMTKHRLATPKQLKRTRDLVFVHPNGRRLSESFIARGLASAVGACETIPDEMKPKVTMHTLRHTAASQMVAGGRTLYEVAQILGHKDVKTTQRYAHFQPEAGKAAIQTLERMLDLDKEDEEPAQVRDADADSRIG